MNASLQIRLRHARTAAMLLIATACMPNAVVAAEAPQVITGRLLVTASVVEVDRTQRFIFEPTKAQCFDFRGAAMTCATLVGIGYADKAHVTVAAGTVKRIDIVKLDQ